MKWGCQITSYISQVVQPNPTSVNTYYNIQITIETVN